MIGDPQPSPLMEFISTLPTVLRDHRPPRFLPRRSLSYAIPRKTGAFAVLALAWLFATHIAAAEPPEAVASRPEKTFVLFRPDAVPGVVSSKGAEDIRTPPPRYEVVYTRWVQKNDFDATSALPGDRVIVEIGPGDAYELVLTSVKRGYQGIVRWRGTVPGRSEITFQAGFSADGKNLFGASMHFAGGRHAVVATDVRDMEGWLGLQSLARVDLAVGPNDDPSALGDDIAKPPPPKPKPAPMQPEAETPSR